MNLSLSQKRSKMSYEDYKRANPTVEQPKASEMTKLVQTRIESTPTGTVVINNGNRSNTDEQVSRSHTNATNASSANAARSAEIVATQNPPPPAHRPPR